MLKLEEKKKSFNVSLNLNVNIQKCSPKEAGPKKKCDFNKQPWILTDKFNIEKLTCKAKS